MSERPHCLVSPFYEELACAQPQFRRDRRRDTSGGIPRSPPREPTAEGWLCPWESRCCLGWWRHESSAQPISNPRWVLLFFKLSSPPLKCPASHAGKIPWLLRRYLGKGLGINRKSTFCSNLFFVWKISDCKNSLWILAHISF